MKTSKQQADARRGTDARAERRNDSTNFFSTSYFLRVEIEIEIEIFLHLYFL
jgi:hypothetical protein